MTTPNLSYAVSKTFCGSFHNNTPNINETQMRISPNACNFEQIFPEYLIFGRTVVRCLNQNYGPQSILISVRSIVLNLPSTRKYPIPVQQRSSLHPSGCYIDYNNNKKCAASSCIIHFSNLLEGRVMTSPTPEVTSSLQKFQSQQFTSRQIYRGKKPFQVRIRKTCQVMRHIQCSLLRQVNLYDLRM